MYPWFCIDSNIFVCIHLGLQAECKLKFKLSAIAYSSLKCVSAFQIPGLLDGTRLEASVCSVKAMDIISCLAGGQGCGARTLRRRISAIFPPRRLRAEPLHHTVPSLMPYL